MLGTPELDPSIIRKQIFLLKIISCQEQVWYSLFLHNIQHFREDLHLPAAPAACQIIILFLTDFEQNIL